MDRITTAQRSEIMRRIGGRDTRPEKTVRRLLHALGYRYQLHCRYLPGSPDIVFPSRKRVVFVHGCFWHWHHDPCCPISKLPKSRENYWRAKFERNRFRDNAQQQELQRIGWEALVVWECELSQTDRLLQKLISYIGPPRRSE